MTNLLRSVYVCSLCFIIALGLYAAKDEAKTEDESSYENTPKEKREKKKEPKNLLQTNATTEMDVDAFIRLINIAPRKDLVEIAEIENIPYQSNDSIEDLRKRILQNRLGKADEAETKEEQAEWVRQKPKHSSKASVTLIHANVVERYETEFDDVIHIYGDVELKVKDIYIEADDIIYSINSDEIFGYGDVLIHTGLTKAYGKWFSLNRKSEEGILFNGRSYIPDEGIWVHGYVTKFKDERFFVDDGYFTMSSSDPPTYHFSSPHLYLWDDKKIMARQITFQVGSQPFFWFPIFLQNYFGWKVPGWKHTFGKTYNEGFYLQNDREWKDWFGFEHKIDADFYQKLGIMLGDHVTVTKDWGNLIVHLMAAYSRTLYRFTPRYGFSGETRYINRLPYDVEHRDKFYWWRWKAHTSGNINLFSVAKEKNTVSWNFTGKSDLYFDTDFVRTMPEFDLTETVTEMIKGENEDETIKSRGATGGWANHVQFTSSMGQNRFNILARWRYSPLDNLSVENNIDNDEYKLRLIQINAPSLSFSHSGTLFPKNLKLAYGFDVSYNQTTKYANISGIHFYTNEFIDEDTLKEEKQKLSIVDYERGLLNFNANMSRAFSIPFASLRFNWGFNYRRQSTSSDIENPINLLYGDKNNTYAKMNGTLNWGIHLPQSILSDTLTKYIQPNLSYSGSYRLGVKIAKEYEASDRFGALTPHAIGNSVTAGLTGFGFLFIPNSTLSLNASTGFSYNLQREYNHITEEYEDIYFPFSEDWRENDKDRLKMSGLNLSASWTLPKDYLRVNYRLSYDIQKYIDKVREIEASTNEMEEDFSAISSHYYTITTRGSIPLKELVYLMAPNLITRRLFKDKSKVKFDLIFTGNFKHDLKHYKNSYINLSLSLSISIADIWRFSFSSSTRNSEPYLYLSHYANKEGKERVPFFADIARSLNFGDYIKRASSLWKMGNFTVSFSHELDGWLLTGGFSMVQRTLPSGSSTHSVKGFYWDKQLWVEIQLKADEFKDIIPKQTIDFNSDLIDQFRQ